MSDRVADIEARWRDVRRDKPWTPNLYAELERVRRSQLEEARL